MSIEIIKVEFSILMERCSVIINFNNGNPYISESGQDDCPKTGIQAIIESDSKIVSQAIKGYTNLHAIF